MPLEFDKKPEKRLVFDETPVRPTGAPAPLAEFAGAANRSIAGTADFLTTGPINEALGLAGVEARLPTFQQGMERATGGTSGFMEPGLARDVTQAAGSYAPAFAAPMKAGVEAIGSFGGKATAKLLEESAPSIDALRKRATALYDDIAKMDAVIPQDRLGKLAIDVFDQMKKSGLNQKLSPKAWGAMEELQKAAQAGGISPSDLETLRKIAGAAKSDATNKLEMNLGRIMQNQIDDFLSNLPEGAITGLDGARAGAILKEARGLTQQRKKAEVIEEAIEIASTRASGFETGLRNEFGNISRRIIKGRLKGFTNEEIKAIRKVSEGGSFENVAKVLGKFGVSEGGAVRALIPGLGMTGAYQIGTSLGGPMVGTAAALGVVTMGQFFRGTASRLTQQNARLSSAVTRAGPDGWTIAASYGKIVPKNLQRPEELAGLLLEGNTPIAVIQSMKNTGNMLVANAAFLVGAATNEASQDNSNAPEN